MATRAVFVLPYALESSLRFLNAAARLEGVHLGLVTQEPPERIPGDLRQLLSGYERVEDALDADQLTRAVERCGAGMGGPVERLIGILEPLQETMGLVRERLGIRGMDHGESLNFRDKARMKERLAAAGLPCARHATVTSSAEAHRQAQDHVGYPLVAKPPAGAGAKATVRIEGPEELEGYVRAAPPSERAPLLLEEFIQGEEFSFDSVTLHGEHVFHSISRYHPRPLEVMEKAWVQWCVILPKDIEGDEFAPIREAGPAALEALGMFTGLSHMEWFRRPDGSIAISEVGARPPGAQFTTLLSAAHDLDFYRVWPELLIQERFQAPPRKYSAGAVYLRGQGSGRVKQVHGLDEVRKDLGELVVEARLPQPGQPRASSYEGEGYVLLRHPDTSEVERGLAHLLQTLRVELA